MKLNSKNISAWGCGWHRWRRQFHAQTFRVGALDGVGLHIQSKTWLKEPKWISKKIEFNHLNLIGFVQWRSVYRLTSKRVYRDSNSKTEILIFRFKTKINKLLIIWKLYLNTKCLHRYSWRWICPFRWHLFKRIHPQGPWRTCAHMAYSPTVPR